MAITMYPYFTWCIILGLVWLILYLYRKDLRYELIFTTLLFLPFGLTGPLFIPDYWNPSVIYKILGIFDLEGFLFMGFLGGISSVLYQEIFNYHLKKTKKKLVSRYHTYIIYFSLVLFILSLLLIKLFTNLSVLRTSFFIIFLLVPYFLIARKDLWILSILGGLTFTFFYILSLFFIDILFEGFITNTWNPAGLWGIYLLNIPIEEYLYAFFFGMVGGVIFEEIKNIKVIHFKR